MGNAIDLIVRTESPYSILDQRMLALGALAHEVPVRPGVYAVRCLGRTKQEAKGRADFVESAIQHQGYGEVLEQKEIE